MRGLVFLRAECGARFGINQRVVDAALLAQSRDRALIRLAAAVRVRAVVRERAKHQKPRQAVVVELAKLAQHGFPIEAQSSTSLLFPAEDLAYADRWMGCGGRIP